MANDVRHLWAVLIGHLYIFCGLFTFSSSSYKGSLYFLDTRPFLEHNLQILSLICELSFYLHDGVLEAHGFNPGEVQFTSFFFCYLCFCCDI